MNDMILSGIPDLGDDPLSEDLADDVAGAVRVRVLDDEGTPPVSAFNSSI